MKQHEVTVPQIGLIAGTRAMLGAGIALLLSEKLSDEQRRAIGWTLVAVGAWIVVYAALSRLHPEGQFWHDALCGTRLVVQSWRNKA